MNTNHNGSLIEMHQEYETRRVGVFSGTAGTECTVTLEVRPISAYNISTVKYSEKKINYDKYKVDHKISNEL